jgi:ribosomal protein S18 acetylase RimI-like enzyme
MNNGRSIGVFITMPGTEIPKRRLFDTLYLLKNCKSDRRLALRDFLSAFANVLLPVGESDFYLRTLAVGAEHRGRGYGRQLLEQAITAGARAGFKRIRLDVNGNNAPALHLYQDCGFKIIHEATVPAFCHRVCAMLLER